ncbi:hypothetical protein [Blattabacterium cuenoti]|uniref:hypothetical protein n=1 Tax=Blattabacterium cuenoti TaxID=1653831 RepID=UPI001EEAC17B|nr:hypothetical protein [Blattabacterium cuenoti]
MKSKNTLKELKNVVLFLYSEDSSKILNTGEIDIMDITENKEYKKLHDILMI